MHNTAFFVIKVSITKRQHCIYPSCLHYGLLCL